MIRCNACPNWLMAFCGAVLTVAALTDGCVDLSSNVTGNDKSNIARYGLDLCSIIAIGEILSSRGGSSFMSFHSITRACPAFTLSCTSRLSCSIAAGTSAEECGPLLMAACMSSFVHGVPDSTGHPCVAYVSRSCAAGCCVARFAGHMLLRKFVGLCAAGGRANKPLYVVHQSGSFSWPI